MQGSGELDFHEQTTRELEFFILGLGLRDDALSRDNNV